MVSRQPERTSDHLGIIEGVTEFIPVSSTGGEVLAVPAAALSATANGSTILQVEASRALRAVHSGFYLSAKTISIGLIGPGTVGATLLSQLQRQSERLALPGTWS